MYKHSYKNLANRSITRTTANNVTTNFQVFLIHSLYVIVAIEQKS